MGWYFEPGCFELAITCPVAVEATQVWKSILHCAMVMESSFKDGFFLTSVYILFDYTTQHMFMPLSQAEAL
jgi:hypothetical protein